VRLAHRGEVRRPLFASIICQIEAMIAGAHSTGARPAASAASGRKLAAGAPARENAPTRARAAGQHLGVVECRQLGEAVAFGQDQLEQDALAPLAATRS
jgi:hypothetical protein